MRNPKIKYAVNRARASQKSNNHNSDQRRRRKRRKHRNPLKRYMTMERLLPLSLPSQPHLHLERYMLSTTAFILDSASTVHICNNPERWHDRNPPKPLMPHIFTEQRRLAHIALVVSPVVAPAPMHRPKLDLAIHYRLRRERRRTIPARKDLKRLLRLPPVLTRRVIPE